MDDHELAQTLAEETGRLLMDVRARLIAEGVSSGELKDEGDRLAHELLMERLAAARPDDAVLSEEGSGDTGRYTTSRVGAPRVWIVDPLDGTREFGEPGRSDWAVHVALVEDGRPTAGAVALPAQGRVLSTASPQPMAPLVGRPRMVVSRTRPPAVAVHLAEALDAELIPMGSAGAKVAAVVYGEADLYPHTGGQYEWDSCAPVAVANATGLWTSRIDCSPLVYNNVDPYLPDLLVCHPGLIDAVRDALAGFVV
ncbi:MAG: 3'(2'),5'-bisphosphate nucleotidase CysQ [Aquihabitans sp.]